MPLSFADRRAQTRTLNAVAFWLQPAAQSFNAPLSSSSTSAAAADDVSGGFDDMEKCCGRIRGVDFDAGVAKSALERVVALAEGLLSELAASRGFTIAELKTSHSLVLHGLTGASLAAHLDLALSVLQCIVDGSPSIQQLTSIAERFSKVVELRKQLEAGGDSEGFVSIFRSMEERVLNCDEISEEEIDEWMEQIDRDQTYQEYMIALRDHSYLLKGLPAVKFLRRALSAATTINGAYFKAIFEAMASIVERLSEEELTAALDEMTATKDNVTQKFIAEKLDLEYTLTQPKLSTALAARLLLCGATTVCTEFMSYLASERPKKGEKCHAALAASPVSVYQHLMGGETIRLAKALFGSRGPFVSHYYETPMKCLVLTGYFPLAALLDVFIGRGFSAHIATIVQGDALKRCLHEMDSCTDEWRTTRQMMISALAILKEGECSKNAVEAVLTLLHKKSSSTQFIYKPEMLPKWLSKFEHGQKVLQLMGWTQSEKKKKEEEGASSWVTVDASGTAAEEKEEDAVDLAVKECLEQLLQRVERNEMGEEKESLPAPPHGTAAPSTEEIVA